MAHSTLARPEVELSQVLNSFVQRILDKPQLGLCCFETVISSGETREADQSFFCYSAATVHDLASDQEYCARHFAEVSRG